MDHSLEYCPCSICFHITRLCGCIQLAPRTKDPPFFGDVKVDGDVEMAVLVEVDSCEDEDGGGVCKCVGESKCGGRGIDGGDDTDTDGTTLNSTRTGLRTNPSIVFDNSRTNNHNHNDTTRGMYDSSMKRFNATRDDSMKKLASMEVTLKDINASDERSRKTIDKINMSLKNDRRQQAESSSKHRRSLIGSVGGLRNVCGRIAFWGWIIIAIILLGKYMFGASKSQRVQHIAESISGTQGVPGMPYFIADALKHMGKHAGWSDDQSFAEFDASHTDHLYETYKEFYDYHGMDHPNAYQGRRSR